MDVKELLKLLIDDLDRQIYWAEAPDVSEALSCVKNAIATTLLRIERGENYP